MAIGVRDEELRRYQADFKRLSNELGEIGDKLESIHKALDNDVKYERNIDSEFRKICDDIRRHESDLKNVAEFVLNTASSYKNT